MPEAAAAPTDQPASSVCADRGSAAGRKPEAAAAPTDHPAPADHLAPGHSLRERVNEAAEGLRPLLAQAEAVRAERARAYGAPRWTDVFTTQFTEFSNRPR